LAYRVFELRRTFIRTVTKVARFFVAFFPALMKSTRMEANAQQRERKSGKSFFSSAVSSTDWPSLIHSPLRRCDIALFTTHSVRHNSCSIEFDEAVKSSAFLRLKLPTMGFMSLSSQKSRRLISADFHSDADAERSSTRLYLIHERIAEKIFLWWQDKNG